VVLAEDEVESEAGTEVPVIVETSVVEVDEHHDAVSEQPEPQHVKPAEMETTTQEVSPATLLSSSLESMSSEFTEQEESPSVAEIVVEDVEAAPKVVEAPKPEKESSVKQEPETKEALPTEKVEEDGKVEES